MKGPMNSMSEEKCGNGTSQNQTLKEVDFSEYVWMGEEMEDFDRKVLEDLCEQEFIEQCFEEMLEEEELEWYYSQCQSDTSQLAIDMAQLSVSEQQPLVVTEQNKPVPAENFQNVQSALNPEAPEFIPRHLLNQEAEQSR